ncbi:hypothetical protein [Aliamphritea spongicola]|nr:hypothetical protein [Aliamphritea spongicola]
MEVNGYFQKILINSEEKPKPEKQPFVPVESVVSHFKTSCFSAGYSDSHQVHFAALPRPCVSMWGRIIGTLTEESTGF